MKKKIFILLLLVLAGVAAFFYVKRTRADGAVISLGGNVDIREVSLSFRVGGRLQSLNVDEGARVKKGDVLGQLDHEPFENAQKEAQAQLAALTANWELMKSGYRAEDVAQAAAVLAARKAVLENAQLEYERNRQLLDNRAISKREADQTKAAYDRVLAEVREAEQRHHALQSGYRPEEVAQAAANVERARAQADIAALALKDTTLVSPADGVILTRAVEPGTLLAAGAGVFSLSLTNPVWVRAYAGERDLNWLVPGKRVRVFTDGQPDKVYAGTIGFVSPTAEFTPKTVETRDLRTTQVYRLRIVVDDADDGLRQGMPVTVEIDRH